MKLKSTINTFSDSLDHRTTTRETALNHQVATQPPQNRQPPQALPSLRAAPAVTLTLAPSHHKNH
ncbi:hypothetical protein BVRB_1g014640 [Beta vulgaris subsp. vulgaris]|nr:hypothetical protein BVRB_1g014640 [Beta vulgaris subsp. vulgaris]